MSTSITTAIIIISSAIIASVSLYLLFRFLSNRLLHTSSRTFSIPDDVASRESNHQQKCHMASNAQSLDSLPLFKFSSVSGNLTGGDCAVCLSKFKKRDQLRLLPLCCHAFHRGCIDAWIVTNQTCPLCRSTVFPSDCDVLDKFSNTENPNNSNTNNRSRNGIGGSFRIEIGSISRREGGGSAIEGARRSYAIGSFEYVVDSNGYEVSVSDRNSENKESDSGIPITAPAREIFPAAEFSSGRNWFRDYVDRMPFNYRAASFRNSGRFFSGSIRRSDSVIAGEDLEANRVGEEISEMFRWFSPGI